MVRKPWNYSVPAPYDPVGLKIIWQRRKVKNKMASRVYLYYIFENFISKP